MNEPTERIQSLDSLRGLASLGIVLFHIQGIHNLTLSPIPAFLVSLLGIGVPLFFTLSAFSIEFSLQKRFLNQYEIKNYLIRRFFRIAPLYYFMIPIYVIFNFYKYGIWVNIQELYLNLTFAFSLSPFKFQGIVWAGWSIGIEIMMYLLLPVFISFANNVRNALLLFLVSLSISMVFSNEYTNYAYVKSLYNHMNIVIMLPFFTLGILIYSLFKIRFLTNLSGITYILINLLIVFVLILVTFNLGLINKSALTYINNYRLLFYSWSLLFLFVLLMQLNKPVKLLHNKFLVFAGKISYSIYLLHPITVFLLLDFYKYLFSHISNNTFAFILCFISTCALLIPISYLSYRFIEIPGMDLGKRIIAKKKIEVHE